MKTTKKVLEELAKQHECRDWKICRTMFRNNEANPDVVEDAVEIAIKLVKAECEKALNYKNKRINVLESTLIKKDTERTRIKKEVEKMDNPYATFTIDWEGFQECRKEVLKIMKEAKG